MLEQAVELLAQGAGMAGRMVGVLDLAQDLRLAQYQRIEAGGHAQDVVRLQVETMAASLTAVREVRSLSASSSLSGANATFSRMATGAVLWLMPNASRVTEQPDVVAERDARFAATRRVDVSNPERYTSVLYR